MDCKPNESFKMIKIRGRKYEEGVTIEYLNKLYNIYEEYMKEIRKVIPAMRVNCSKFKTVKELAQIIKTEFENKHTIKDVDNNKSILKILYN